MVSYQFLERRPLREIDDVFHRVTREVVEYAGSVENPVLVLEDLTHIRESMDYGEYLNRRLHGWR